MLRTMDSFDDDYRIALEVCPTPILVVAKDGAIRRSNDRLDLLFGYEPNELVGQAIEVLVPPETRGHHPDLRDAFFEIPTRRSMGTDRRDKRVGPCGRKLGRFSARTRASLPRRSASLPGALQAIKTAPSPTRVMTDGGCENFGLTEINQVVHVIAQVDIAQSNSLIESLWSQIRSRWLYIHTLDSFQVLERLLEKYFNDHNELIPRAELSGRTPNEAFFGQEDDLRARLRMEHTQARIRRITENQARTCPACSNNGTEPVM